MFPSSNKISEENRHNHKILSDVSFVLTFSSSNSYLGVLGNDESEGSDNILTRINERRDNHFHAIHTICFRLYFEMKMA